MSQHTPKKRYRTTNWKQYNSSLKARAPLTRAICVTSNEVSDAAVIADLLKQVPRNEAMLNAAVAACRRLGRRMWKVWSHYHRKSLVETK